MPKRPENIIGIIEKKHLLDLFRKKKIRLDGRSFEETRPVKIEINVIKKAEGSAKVTLGKTIAVAGVKLELGTPFPDTPSKGVMIVNTELSPIASPTLESGPPTKESIEIARVIDRGIRESQAVDVDTLCVVSGEKVWIIFVDIYFLGESGNFFDAGSIATMAALKSARMPVVKVEADGTIKKTDETTPLPLKRLATSQTFVKVDEYIFADPSLEEERIADTRFTCAFTEEGRLCAVQKGLNGTLKQDQVMEMVKLGKEKCLEHINEIKENSIETDHLF
ncbi:MAG: exosome complex protein Rrp42 [Candidatus Hodarchaeales archaeon]